MPTLHLSECVAHRREEVSVGAEDGAIECELDHAPRAMDRLQLSLMVSGEASAR